MREHIRLTIEDLRATIERGQQMIAFLEAFESANQEETPARPVMGTLTLRVHEELPLDGKSKIKSPPALPAPARQATSKSKNPSDGASGKLGPKVEAASARMKEPFSKHDICKLLLGKYTVGSIHYQLLQLAKSGRLKIVREGAANTPALYARKGKWQGALEKAEVPAGNGARSGADLEAKLKAAIAQRDHAKENFRGELVEMFEKDIASIRAEMEAAA